MSLFWVTLFFFHQGHSLVPVVTVGLGEPVTFTCANTETYQTKIRLHWYKQSAGENLKIISVQHLNTIPTYGPGFSESKFKTTFYYNTSNLTILKTSEEDEGLYHCAYMDWTKSTWNGTYLSIKGDSERTSHYTVVEQSGASGPVHPADMETLQCSLLTESKNKTCSGEVNVFWFRAQSEKSYPEIIYADENNPDKCSKTSDTQRRCNFSKNIHSSDPGTYYCAVATCGRILFGEAFNLVMDKNADSKTLLVGSVICLAFSVIVNIIFICCRIQKSCKENSTPHDDSSQLDNDITASGPDLNYAALRFSGRKSTKAKRELKAEESVYSQVKETI